MKTRLPLCFKSDNKINLLNFSYEQMRNFFINIKEKEFCADQIMIWIYHKYCDDFDKMTNISKKLREKLKEKCVILPPKFISEKISLDGTIKWGVMVNQDIVETVYIPEKNRSTLCISSQIGCPLKCKFCATGEKIFKGNLKVSEIIGQIWSASKIINHHKFNHITNIVLMGMGEPLLNFKNVINGIKIMLHKFGFNISKNKITLSTAGIIPSLDELSYFVNINLAISLHAPNDIIRNQIMPINKKYNIQKLLYSANNYLQKSKSNRGRLTIEYVMLDGINDKNVHAEELARLLKKIPAKINLIPWNIFSKAIYKTSSSKRIKAFSEILIKKGFITIVRKNRGSDINAACGQLRSEIKLC